MNNKDKSISYENAVNELESIVTRLEKGDCDIDQLTQELKRAQKLIAFCRERLFKTEKEIKKLTGE
jgi:exodeoxyribonuclease VII small subunit